VYDFIIQRPQPAPRGVVHASCRQGRASKDPPQGKSDPAHRSLLTDGELGVTRTARVEATVPTEHLAQGEAIRSHQGQQKHARRPSGHPHPPAESHRHSAITPAAASALVISSTSSRVFASRIWGRAMKTMSYPAVTRGATPRQASLRRRRALFRTTAPPTCRAHTKPARVVGPEGRTYTTTRLWGRRMPSSRTRLNSDPLRMRCPLAGRPRPDRVEGTGCVDMADSSSELRRSSGGDAGPPLAPAPGQDAATAARLHTQAEPMPLLTPSVVGLERALHSASTSQETLERATESPRALATRV
jgi:hypothetical protein